MLGRRVDRVAGRHEHPQEAVEDDPGAEGQGGQHEARAQATHRHAQVRTESGAHPGHPPHGKGPAQGEACELGGGHRVIVTRRAASGGAPERLFGAIPGSTAALPGLDQGIPRYRAAARGGWLEP